MELPQIGSSEGGLFFEPAFRLFGGPASKIAEPRRDDGGFGIGQDDAGMVEEEGFFTFFRRAEAGFVAAVAKQGEA